MDQAKAQGQPISLAAQDGTPAAGVHRVTELMPMLMNDIIATAPEDQKVRRKQRSIQVLSHMPGACEESARAAVAAARLLLLAAAARSPLNC